MASACGFGINCEAPPQYGAVNKPRKHRVSLSMSDSDLVQINQQEPKNEAKLLPPRTLPKLYKSPSGRQTSFFHQFGCNTDPCQSIQHLHESKNLDEYTPASATTDENSDDDSVGDEDLEDIEKWYEDGTEHHQLKPLSDFLNASTALPQLVMWGFLAWYIAIIFYCWNNLKVEAFIGAFAIMLLIGLVLNANAFVAYKFHIENCPNSHYTPTLMTYLQTQMPSIIRLFVIPYCVSSYSGIASTTPGFFIIFPTKLSILLPVFLISVAFPMSLRISSDYLAHVIYPKETSAHRNNRRRDSKLKLLKV